MNADIINYYLNNPISDFRYMRIHIRYIPHEVIVEYSLLSITDSSRYVYVNIRNGMYGLKESGIIAYKRLVKKTSNLMATPLCKILLAFGPIIPLPPPSPLM